LSPASAVAEPDVDAVIVTYNSASQLAACVAAARAWPRLHRVVVVDNGSGDDSADLAEGVADVVVRGAVNVGFGAAQNRGRAESTAPYVLILNPDARVAPAGLEAGRSVLETELDVAAVEGPIFRTADGSEERWQGSEPGLADLVARLLRLRRWLGENRLKRLARALGIRYYADRAVPDRHDVDFLAAVAPLVRREALDQVGGFDPSFFLYAEDVDLCHRLRSAGWRLVATPEPWATHVGGASSAGAATARSRHWWESHRLLVARHWSGGRRWTGLGLATVGTALARLRERRGSWATG
jgi:N-acetylglucosaminyl-diphospho-decaprenol L-rhamnosyltransferase